MRKERVSVADLRTVDCREVTTGANDTRVQASVEFENAPGLAQETRTASRSGIGSLNGRSSNPAPCPDLGGAEILENPSPHRHLGAPWLASSSTTASNIRPRGPSRPAGEVKPIAWPRTRLTWPAHQCIAMDWRSG